MIRLLMKTRERTFFYTLLFIFFIVLFTIAFTSTGTYDYGDGVQHYLISRYAWKYPEMFLDLWGKPVFILLSSPFFQLGMIGANLFNIFCAIFSCLFCYKISDHFGLQHKWVLAFFICFAPIYFAVINSGLVEPLFSLMLVIAVFLTLKDQYNYAAILLSFLPFVRPEAYFVIPVFIVVFLINKKYLSLLLLLTGTIAYSIAGYFYFDDIFWLRNRDPYNDTSGYNNAEGELLHYIKNADEIIGWPLAILFLLGCIYNFISLFNNTRFNIPRQAVFSKEFLLIFGIVIIYISAHSILWGAGIFPTLGMFRYMGGIIPLLAIVCLQGLNLILNPVNNHRLKITIITIVIVCVSRVPFKQYFYPFKLQGEQLVLKEAGDFVKKNSYLNNKVYYMHPFLTMAMDVDPFDKQKIGLWCVIDPSQPDKNMPEGSVIIWDAHFGPNECGLPVEAFLNNPHFKVLKKFVPQNEITVLGGHKFEVYVFQKII